jgi:hypothetical protein
MQARIQNAIQAPGTKPLQSNKGEIPIDRVEGMMLAEVERTGIELRGGKENGISKVTV